LQNSLASYLLLEDVGEAFVWIPAVSVAPNCTGMKRTASERKTSRSSDTSS